MTNLLQVEFIASDSPYLSKVVGLADQNSRYLGHFPASCFAREADLGRILVAHEGGSVCGYILFRTARNRVVIQHLCVEEASRGRGVARQLIERLKAHTSSLDGISLHCAREFEDAQAAWRRLGFVAIDEKQGRGKDCRILTRFWFDYRHDDLWSEARRLSLEKRLVVVMDANVAFDLQDTDRETSRASLPLHDSWLKDFVVLYITDECFNEVNRSDDEHLRKRRRDFLRSIPKVDEPRSARSAIESRLGEILGDSGRASSSSDIKQLVAAAEAGASAFVTNDNEILAYKNQIESEIGLRVCTPAGLIGELDELVRAAEYAPASLAGTGVFASLVRSSEIDSLANKFLLYGRGEKKRSVLDKLSRLIAMTSGAKLWRVTVGGGQDAGLLGLDLSNDIVAKVVFLRAQSRKNALTLSYLMLAKAISQAVESGHRLLLLEDSAEFSLISEACREMGFVPASGGYMKVLVSGIGTKAAHLQNLTDLAKFIPQELVGSLNDIVKSVSSSSPDRALSVERILWPAKLSSSSVDNYIIPIRPNFAASLFDTGLASEHLIGIDPMLLFGPENVYYRSARPAVVGGPGRVLWYISSERDRKIGAVRACSEIMSVEVDTAKSLFRKYKRLGVYSWADVDEIASRHPSSLVMAIRFGLTKVYPKELRRTDLADLLESTMGTVPPLSTAVKIPGQAFDAIVTCMSLQEGTRI